MKKEFAEDFIKLQGCFSSLPKDKSGYGYKYTDLDTIIKYIKPLCLQYNIGFMQNLKTVLNENGAKTTGLETIIIHSSGETISSIVEIPDIQVGKANNAQNIGAAITYFKRYALAAAFGISSDEDIDCSSLALDSCSRASETTAPTVKNISSNKVSKNNNKNFTAKKETPAAAPQLTIKPYTADQAAKLGEIMNATFTDGAPIFEADEKGSYRTMLMNGEVEKAIQQAQAEKAAREKSKVLNGLAQTFGGEIVTDTAADADTMPLF